jgi:large subunit ribosomal protein L9
MKIILLERVQKLGSMGEMVEVKPGYARNYLLPLKKAIRATKDNITSFQNKRLQLEEENAKNRKEAEKIAKRIDGVIITLIRQASETGHLYGSVRSSDISDALTDAGISIQKNQVLIPQPIKIIGMHKISICLHPEISILAKINVAQSEEEAYAQETQEHTRTQEQAKEQAKAKENVAAQQTKNTSNEKVEKSQEEFVS